MRSFVKKDLYDKIYNPFISFGISLLVVFLICLIRGITPFGYVPASTDADKFRFIGYFRSIFFEGNGIFQSFSKMAGGVVPVTNVSYLTDPFNFIYLLFPHGSIGKVFTVVEAVKAALAAFAVSAMFNAITYPEGKRNLFNLALSVNYGVFAFFSGTKTDLILLPLIVLGVFRLLDGERSTFLVVFLSVAALINPYSGAVSAGVALLIFIRGMIFNRFEKKTAVWLCVRTGVSILIALLVSSCGWYLIWTLLGIRFNAFPAAAPLNVLLEGSNGVYAGSLVIILIICFILSRAVSVLRKVTDLTILAMSLAFVILDPVSGTDVSYIAVFIAFLTAGYFISEGEDGDLNSTVIALIGTSLAIIKYVYIKFINTGSDAFLYAVFTAVFAVLVAAFLLVKNYKPENKVLAFIFAVICLASYSEAALKAVYTPEPEYDYSVASEESRVLLDSIRTFDPGVYKVFYLNSEVMSGSKYVYFDNAGFKRISSDGNALTYKYIVSDTDMALESLGEYNGKTVYLNPYALPVAFAFDGSDLSSGTDPDKVTELNRSAATAVSLQDTKMMFKIYVRKSSKFLICVPYDFHWKAYVNGNAVPVESYLGKFMMLDIKGGDNSIVLEYELPRLRSFACLSAAGIVVLLAFLAVESFTVKREEDEY
ncbi:MAG: YfhO family protein [Clostridiales bacterium]|nr:YfhO family protein [Clostridiales bacterium]